MASDSSRRLITRADIERASGDLRVPVGTIVTPSARDLADQKGIVLVAEEAETAPTAGTAANARVRSLRNFASAIDHTNLSPTATSADIVSLCAEAIEHQFAAVCVAPIRVAQAARELSGRNIAVCGVVGFPSGGHLTEIKVAEAARCVTDGAGEIDMVAATGLLRDGDFRAYAEDIGAVRRATGDDVILKVIIETSLLDESDIVRAACIAAESGVCYVKTSTGVYGQARAADVALLRRALPPEIKIKAAGGIRNAEFACALLDAGADRLGMSASVAMMWEYVGKVDASRTSAESVEPE